MKLQLTISDNEYKELMRTLKNAVAASDDWQALVLEHHRTTLAQAAAVRDTSHVAWYTKRMMKDLLRDGWTIQIIPDWRDQRENQRQRNRMYNAGRRLGLSITTEAKRCDIASHDECTHQIITGRVTGGTR